MEQFDNKAVGRAQDMKAQVKASTFVQESKSRQRNAWGGGSSVSDNSSRPFDDLKRAHMCMPSTER